MCNLEAESVFNDYLRLAIQLVRSFREHFDPLLSSLFQKYSFELSKQSNTFYPRALPASFQFYLWHLFAVLKPGNSVTAWIAQNIKHVLNTWLPCVSCRIHGSHLMKKTDLSLGRMELTVQSVLLSMFNAELHIFCWPR